MVITWMQLQAARESAGLTQVELAKRIGVSPRTIVNWEAQGVPRKSEHKVVDALGDHLDSRNRRGGLGVGLGKMIAESASWFPKDPEAVLMKEASDEQLLNELLTRAQRRRKMFEGSTEEALPEVSGQGDTAALHDIDLRQSGLELAATTDTSSVEEQSHPKYEDENQDHPENE